MLYSLSIKKGSYYANTDMFSELFHFITISMFSWVMNCSLFSMRLNAWASSSFLRLRRLFLSSNGLYWLSASRRRFNWAQTHTETEGNQKKLMWQKHAVTLNDIYKCMHVIPLGRTAIVLISENTFTNKTCKVTYFEQSFKMWSEILQN